MSTVFLGVLHHARFDKFLNSIKQYAMSVTTTDTRHQVSPSFRNYAPQNVVFDNCAVARLKFSVEETQSSSSDIGHNLSLELTSLFNGVPFKRSSGTPNEPIETITTQFSDDSAINFFGVMPRPDAPVVIYLVRHGIGTHNVGDDVTKHLTRDPFLHSTLGIQLAAQTIVTDLDIQKYSTLYLISSPLRRAIQTLYAVINQITEQKELTDQDWGLRTVSDRICILPCLRELDSKTSGESMFGHIAPENWSVLNPWESTDFDSVFHDTVIINHEDGTKTLFRDIVNEETKSIIMDWELAQKDCRDGQTFLNFLPHVIKQGSILFGSDTYYKNLIGSYGQCAQNVIQHGDKKLPIFVDNSFLRNNVWFMTAGGRRTSFYGMLNRIKHFSRQISSDSKWTILSTRDEWILHDLWQIERRSTIFWLNLLGASVISPRNIQHNPPYTLKWTGSDSPTGVWQYEDIRGDVIGISLTVSQDQQPASFVLASGPSASGKTFFAQKIVNEIIKRPMVNADGSLSRAHSLIYQATKNVMGSIRNMNVTAKNSVLKILIKSFGLGEFDSDKIKNQFKTFLETQLKSTGGINIYIPDTLSSSESSRFVDQLRILSRADPDNSYQIMIFQHLTPEQCLFRGSYQCVGTEPSGKARQRQQSKIYSPLGYWSSMARSIDALSMHMASNDFHFVGDSPRSPWENSVMSSLSYLTNSPAMGRESRTYGRRMCIHNAGRSDRESIGVFLQDADTPPPFVDKSIVWKCVTSQTEFVDTVRAITHTRSDLTIRHKQLLQKLGFINLDLSSPATPRDDASEKSDNRFELDIVSTGFLILSGLILAGTTILRPSIQ